MRIVVDMVLILFLTTTTLYADTIIMKDKKRIKGLVVDEYVDRIVLNTVDGEKGILRRDIERIEYDTPEQSFMQLGRSYDAKRQYDKAVQCYKKALQINPDYNEARDAYRASYKKMWHGKEQIIKKELKYRNIVKDWWGNRNKESSLPAKDKKALLKETLGISLVEKEGAFIIDKVSPYSSARRSGIEKGDVLVSIWGKNVRYSKKEDVIKELLGPKYSEVTVSVERQISIPVEYRNKNLYKELGLLLEFEYDGLVIKDVTVGKLGEFAGFEKGDFVIAIDGNITRYLPLDSVVELINSTKNNKNIGFSIRRTINLRRQ